jgi:hypothetical protein
MSQALYQPIKEKHSPRITMCATLTCENLLSDVITKSRQSSFCNQCQINRRKAKARQRANRWLKKKVETLARKKLLEWMEFEK